MKIFHDDNAMSCVTIKRNTVILDTDGVSNHPMENIPLNVRSVSKYLDKHIFYSIEHLCNEFQNGVCYEYGVGLIGQSQSGQKTLKRLWRLGGKQNSVSQKGSVPLPLDTPLALTMPDINELLPFPHIRAGNETYIIQPDTYLYFDKSLHLSFLSGKDLYENIRDDTPRPTQHVILNKTGRPLKPETGTLLWNPRTNNLEFYDGDEWRTVGLT